MKEKTETSTQQISELISENQHAYTSKAVYFSLCCFIHKITRCKGQG